MNGTSRKTARALGLLGAILLCSSPAPAQQWTGKARIEGRITNEKGETVADAVVKLRHKNEGPDVKGGKNGRFAYLGLMGGSWDLDISAPGYETFKTTVELSELTHIPPMNIKLKAEAPRTPEAAPAVEPIPWGVQLDRTRESGRRIYLRRCAGCHGKEGDGFGINATKLETPPADFTSPQFRGAHPKGVILDWLEGRRPRPAPLCPNWRETLSLAESNAVAEYLLKAGGA